ncbi:MAG: sensor histidine kinase [Solirubrobacteraceae bacterium]
MIDALGLARRDVAIALAAAAVFIAECAFSSRASGAFVLDALFYGAAGLSFAWRRRYPVAVQLGSLALGGLATLTASGVTEIGAALLLLVVPSYALGHEREGRRSWQALVAGLVLMGAITGISADVSLNNVGFPAGIMVASWTCGRLLRNRLLLSRTLADEAARLELDRELRAQAAVGEERARIAREMHDVIAHTMAIMVVQAGAARSVLDRDPARAEQALGTVEDTGRVALGELRRLLGFLREDGPAALEPQPTLAGLGALVARAREAGLPVELRVDGGEGELPSGAELAVYRIVQEALTNALKHAGPGARALVVLSWTPAALAVAVSDRGGSGAAGGGTGQGLVGMRERVALHGGTFSAGPTSGGGFAVHVTIPRSEVLA